MCAGFHTGFYALGGTLFWDSKHYIVKNDVVQMVGSGGIPPPQKICEKIAVLRLNLVGCGPVAARQYLYVFKTTAV